jgi:ornithine cyclodeaminase/alanine dehydrogenase-like protein (mu-crystallin family)
MAGDLMKTLVVSYAEAKQLLPMRECIDVMADALSALARGEAEMPLRTIFRPQDVRGVMAMMPSFRREDTPLFGLKAICVFPDNAAIGKDAHQGAVLLFSGETGELLALVNASAITEIRTAAVSAVATRALAREDASELAIIGAGVQARSHLEAIACVRPIKRVRIAARTYESARRFVEQITSLPATNSRLATPALQAVETSEEAVRNADIIVTATNSFTPVVQREWISPGAHINAVGTYSFKARELDTTTMADATLFVDRRESALNEAGDYVIAAAEGAIGPEHIRAEVGELLMGSHPGRTSNEEITVFKSLGLAIEDLASAAHVYAKAREQAAGSWVEFD